MSLSGDDQVTSVEGGVEGENVLKSLKDDDKAAGKVKMDEESAEIGDRKRLKAVNLPGKPRGATYDGNVCLVCGDRASGLHYGVLACEGCKGFFKRVCKEKLAAEPTSNDGGDMSQKRQCLFGGNCEINMRTRNRCQYCRIQKCIELGMSKDGIKLGRRSKNFKQNLDSANSSTNSVSTKSSDELSLIGGVSGFSTLQIPFVTSSSTTDNGGKQLIGIIQDNALILKSIDVISGVEGAKLESLVIKNDLTPSQPSLSFSSATTSVMPALILNNNSPSAILMINTANDANESKTLTKDQESAANRSYPILIYHPHGSNVVQSNPNATTSSSNRPTETGSETSIYSMLNESEVGNIVQATYQAYRETTFDYNSNGQSAETPIEQDNAQSHDVLRHLFSRGLIEFLKASKFLDHFNVLIENAVLFAKNTPYFMNINETDRITLLKSCVFQVICVRHANYFFSTHGFKAASSASQSEIVELATYALITPAALTDRFLIPIYNSYVTRNWFAQYLPRMSDLINLLFDFYKQFQQYDLNEVERSLFCAYLLFNTDNSTLIDYSDLINYRELFGDIFLNTLVKRLTSNPTNGATKISDLLSRSLPGESSLRAKETTGRIKTWMVECYSKLKQIDVEHAKLLNEYKSFVVWPDLYSELYNL